MAKKVSGKAFWRRIRFKYKLSFINESSLDEVWSIRLSLLTVLIYVGIFSFALIALTSLIIILTPIRNYLPGYLDVEIRKEILQNALRADSLGNKLEIQAQYLANIANILSGNVSIDSITQAYEDSLTRKTANYDIPRSEREQAYIKQFEESEKYNLTALNPNPPQTDLFFHKPLNGVVSLAFNAEKRHYGIDLTAAKGENVLATLDGTVVYAGFDPNYGNVIFLQHKSEFVSVYKHNDMLLKAVGDKAFAGEAIAVIGNSGEITTGPHLHFELWHKGAPVNPKEYIAF